MYFEGQSFFSLQCGRHSVNNLLGQEAYTKKMFDDICSQLSDQFPNPHCYIFGGDYDANVLLIALQKKNYQSEWFNKSKSKFKIDLQTVRKNKVIGYLINIPMPRRFYHWMFGLSSRHWLVLRIFNEELYFLDSNKNDKLGPKSINCQSANTVIETMIEEGAQIIQIYQSSMYNQ